MPLSVVTPPQSVGKAGTSTVHLSPTLPGKRPTHRKHTIGDQDDEHEALSRPSSLIYPSMLESKYQKSPVQSKTPTPTPDTYVVPGTEAKAVGYYGEIQEEEASAFPSSQQVMSQTQSIKRMKKWNRKSKLVPGSARITKVKTEEIILSNDGP